MKKIKIFHNNILVRYQNFNDLLSEKLGIFWPIILLSLITFFATYLAILIRQYVPWLIIGSKDEGIFQPWMVLPALAHTIIAGEQIAKVSIQKNNVINAKNLAKVGYKEKAKELFIMNAFIRINIVNKGILFLTSMVFYFHFITYPYDSVDTLIKTVGSTMLVLYALWAGAMELDDEFHGIYKTSIKEAEDLIGEKIFNILYKKRIILKYS